MWPSHNGASIKVIISNGVSWECSGIQGTSVGNVSYGSDTTGNWNLTSIDMLHLERTTFDHNTMRLYGNI